jgi:ATP-dependent Lhr-like helicase
LNARAWFQSRGWTPYAFQEEAWSAYRNREQGLIHVPTGAGKTYAALMGPLEEIARNPEKAVQLVYLSPLRALTRDLEKAILEPLRGLEIRVESRTGDTSSSARARQKKKPPNILITTPESLSVLLSDPEAPKNFSHLRSVIVDEWHELMGTKRGTQVELALARLRKFSRPLTWGLSATLGNIDEALTALMPVGVKGRLICSDLKKKIEIDSLIPRELSSVPWAGHVGVFVLKQLIEEIDFNSSTLLFTHTRSQAERWFRELSLALPERKHEIALHHGSLDRKERERVEAGVKDGAIKLVVATSSLDLGVDFTPVTRVFQLGSPKGVGRIIQRAGRSGHQPQASSRITLVPTHSLELLEIAAVRRGIEKGIIETRPIPRNALDVLAQHMGTCALGGGFRADELYQEVRTADAYKDLTREDFNDTLQLVHQGGKVLGSYPEFRRVEEVDGVYHMPNRRFARLHRLNIGTITGDASVDVKSLRNQRLGSIEESFISRLRPGDRFVFTGKVLEFVRMRDNVAYTKASHKKSSLIPRWQGGRLPISPSLSELIRRELSSREKAYPESVAVSPLLEVQKLMSDIPMENQVLAEVMESREGRHLFLYPFEGRLVHEGLAAVLAYRMGLKEKGTFSLTVNDYGIEFLAHKGYSFELALTSEIFTLDGLLSDILKSLNLSELAKRQFREIARIAGLVFQNYAGQKKTARQLQSSSSLLYDVFINYDPSNLLLAQAQREALENQFEQGRLVRTMERLRTSQILWSSMKRFSPFAFPLTMERLSSRLSTETLSERIYRMKKDWTEIAER